MVIMKWEEYPKETKKELLNHWWYYYGKMIFTLDEWNKFNQLVEEKPDLVFRAAVTSYLCGESSQMLIMAMRNNKVDEYFSSLPNKDKFTKSQKKEYEKIERNFLVILSDSYDRPKENVPMDEEEVIKQVLQLKRKNNNGEN